VTFRGDRAELALPPTSSVDAGAVRLRLASRPAGAPRCTPAWSARTTTLRVEQVRDPRRARLLVVVTDGRHTSGPPPRRAAALLAARGVASVVVDCEPGAVRLGMAASLAADLGGTAVRLDELAAAPLAGLVRDLRRDARADVRRAGRKVRVDASGQPTTVPDDGLTTRQRRNRPLLVVHTER
jgi:magnesium chelatase subunit D